MAYIINTYITKPRITYIRHKEEISDGEGIITHVKTQLCLQVAQLVFKLGHSHQNNILRLQWANTLHVEEELIGFGFPVEWGFN